MRWFVLLLAVGARSAVAQRVPYVPAGTRVVVWAHHAPESRAGWLESTRHDTVFVRLERNSFGYFPVRVIDTLVPADIDSIDIWVGVRPQRLYVSIDTSRRMYATPQSSDVRAPGSVVRIWSRSYGLANARAAVLRGDATGDSLWLDFGANDSASRRAMQIATMDTLQLRLVRGSGPAVGALQGLGVGLATGAFGYLVWHALCDAGCHWRASTKTQYFGVFAVAGLAFGRSSGRRAETWIDVHPAER